MGRSLRGKSRLRRFFAAAALGAVGFGGYKFMEPDVNFDNSLDYEPTETQQHFLNDVAENNFYVAFGDTDHRKPEIHLFAYSEEIMGVLEDAGKKNFFVETGPDKQAYFDYLYEEGHPTPYNYQYADGNMWMCSDDAERRLNETFERSASGHDIRIIGADMRHSDQDPRNQLTFGDQMKIFWFFQMPLSAYNTVYGCVDTKAFYLPGILMWATGGDDALMAGLTDDNPTADYIASFPDPGAILYGAGHYSLKQDEDGNAVDMISLLEAKDRTVAVIEIYRDREHRAEMSGVSSGNSGEQHVDAIFYVNPPDDLPHGIDVINPEFQDELERAIQMQKKPPADVSVPMIPGV